MAWQIAPQAPKTWACLYFYCFLYTYLQGLQIVDLLLLIVEDLKRYRIDSLSYHLCDHHNFGTEGTDQIALRFLSKPLRSEYWQENVARHVGHSHQQSIWYTKVPKIGLFSEARADNDKSQTKISKVKEEEKKLRLLKEQEARVAWFPSRRSEKKSNHRSEDRKRFRRSRCLKIWIERKGFFQGEKTKFVPECSEKLRNISLS